MVTKEVYTLSEAADALGKSTETLRRWDNTGKLVALREPISNYRIYKKEQLEIFPQFNSAQNGKEVNHIEPDRDWKKRE